jgi:hypothetical protein
MDQSDNKPMRRYETPLEEILATRGRNLTVEELTNLVLDAIAADAAWHGYRSNVDFMIRRGARDFDLIAEYAARKGHADIVDDMIEAGARNFDAIAMFAARGGHASIVRR